MKDANERTIPIDLSGFYGTENYWQNQFYKFVYTDGVKYLAENAKCHWLLSDISLFQTKSEIKDNADLQNIQFWTLNVKEGGSAKLICEVDAGKTAFEMNYEYTCIPLPKVRLYLCNMHLYWGYTGKGRGMRTDRYGTLLLPSEY